MQHQLSTDDIEFREQFVAGRIAPSTFHHREHVRLAYIFLIEHGEQAGEKFRDALQSFLRHHGIDPAKYHETLTQAWLLAVAHFMKQTPAQGSSADFILANPIVLEPDIMLTHYSQGVIASEPARHRFISPDRLPIPQ